MKYLKRFENIALDEPRVKKFDNYIDLPPIKNDGGNGGGGDGDDNRFPYLEEWLDYFKDKEIPQMFSEIWADEKYRKQLENFKDTEAFKFYSKLWYEHMYDHPQIKQQIESEITQFIDSYNKSVYDLDRQREISKEVDEIINTHEIELGGKKVTYKLEKPQKGNINMFIKSGESEEEANKMLFHLLEIEDIYDKNNDISGDEFKNWIRNIFNPFFEKYVEPFVEENNWRLWSY